MQLLLYSRKKITAKDNNLKKNAFELYLEGLGFRAIGRLLKVSNVSIYKWIKKFGKDIEKLRSHH